MSQDSPDWLKLPVELQHQYFKLAEQEDQKSKAKLFNIEKKLESFKSLKFENIPTDSEWKDWTIAVVDGSFSPTICERVGVRYGVFNAGYMLFRGSSLKSEKYETGMLRRAQASGSERTAKLLSLLTTLLERRVAVRCLENLDIDLLLIDGSFFGFRSGCSAIRGKQIGIEEFVKGEGLVEEVKRLTIKLMNSKKTIGIIKRVRTCALQGWFAQKQSNEGIPANQVASWMEDINDRAILARLMPPETWFAYEGLLGTPQAFNYLAAIKAAIRQQIEAGYTRTFEEVLRMHVARVDRAILENLGCSSDEIFKTSRYYLRSCGAAFPFCFEADRDMNVAPVVAYFQANCNKATGLPFPLDLIDSNVSLPQGFTKEFMQEVEATIIRDSEIKKIAPGYYFASLNPQKEE